MTEKIAPGGKRSRLAGKILKIIFRLVLAVILLVALLALLILTPPVQHFITEKATTFLSKKLNTRIEIGKLYLKFPKKIAIENLYVEDLSKDTLAYGGNIEVDVSMLKLLSGELELNEIKLSEVTAKIRRTLPDTAFNFQFIADAFSSPEKDPAPDTSSSSMKITVRNIALGKIRLLYDDAVTGNDVTLQLDRLDTRFRIFDLDQTRFELDGARISGLNASLRQKQPLVTAIPIADNLTQAPTKEERAASLHFDFGKIQLENSHLDYANDISAISGKATLGKLTITSNNIDLAGQIISLDQVELSNANLAVRLGKTTNALKKEAGSTAPAGGWNIRVKNIALNDNDIVYNDDSKLPIKQGLDYAHLHAWEIGLQAEDFLFTPDSIAGSVLKGEMKEKSGFQLNKLETDFLVTSSGMTLHRLLLETPGTLLQPSVSLRYPSLAALQKDIGSLQLNADINKSKVQVKDILLFAPFLSKQPGFGDPSAIWTMDGRVSGSVADLRLEDLTLTALRQTRLKLNGTIAGLPEVKNLKGNLSIDNFHTGKADLQTIIPREKWPENITLPDFIDLRGTLSGSAANAMANLQLATNLGNLSLQGSAVNAADKNRASYDVRLALNQVQLGKIMQNDTLYGPLNGHLAATGRGFEPKTAKARIKGAITSAFFNRYTYTGIDFSGQLDRQNVTVNMTSADPNLRFALEGESNIAPKYPSIKLRASITDIHTLPLHFTTDSISYQGDISVDFPTTDPANLRGQALIVNSKLAANGRRYALDSINLLAGRSDSGQFIRFTSEALYAELAGRYQLDQLGQIAQRSIDPYFRISPPDSAVAADKPADSLTDYDFSVALRAVEGPLWKVFLPALESFEPIDFKARISAGRGLEATATAPFISLGGNRIKHFTLQAETKEGAIQLRTGIDEFTNGASFVIYRSTINAAISHNTIDFLANINDRSSRNKYRIGAVAAQSNQGVYTISFHPDSLLLNYNKWTIAPNNLISLNKGDIHIREFLLSRGTQQLDINSQSEEPNAPLEIEFNNFRIGTITAFANQDSLIADGVINGQALLHNISGQPTFTSDLSISDLSIKTDTVGNIALKVSNTTENVFTADAAITGMGNDVQLTGKYFVKPANQSIFDLAVDIRKMQMTSLQALSAGAISRTSGFIDGRFDIKGTFEKPNVDGKVQFNEARFSPTLLGGYFKIDKQQINVANQAIRFNNFSVQDSLGNELTLDGAANTSNFVNYAFNMTLVADNFQALNSVKQRGNLFFGQFYFDADLRIKGTEAKPVVDGSLTVNERTRLTIILPQEEPGVADRDGVIRFIDIDSLRMDTALLITADTLNKTGIRGMDVSVNIEVNKNAELTLIVDEANGDFLRMKGTAQLNGGIDPSGKTTLTGAYEIDEGDYEFSLNLIKRKFKINKGSKIVWLGEPTKANVTLTALYVANTAPLSLVENQSNISNLTIYKQRLPFEVNLKLTGELLKPQVAFDVILPADKNYNVDASVIENVNARLTQLRNEPSELNKQVFALLLLNRFVNENPFANSGGGGIESIARQSVSKLLTEQLNTLAQDLVKGVDLNFDVASSDDYTTGNQQNRTDLNVSLSKQLLNDRLKVTVGSNFELEGPQNNNQKSNNLAGNVALDYLLSKDGRYLLRAYRKNEYEGELDGYIIETGLNFIITLDYDHFRELFHLPKNQKREKKKTSQPDEKDVRKAGPVIPPAHNTLP